MSYSLTEYCQSIYNVDKFKNTVSNVRLAVRRVKFDVIAFRGSSGAAVAFPLALSRNKGLLHIRKERSHSNMKVEGLFGVNRYIVIDDFICSGRTMRTIKREIIRSHKEANVKVPKCVAVVLYSTRSGPGAFSQEAIARKVFPDAQIFCTME